MENVSKHLFHVEGDYFVAEIAGNEYPLSRYMSERGMSHLLFGLNNIMQVFNRIYVVDRGEGFFSKHDITSVEFSTLIKIYDLKVTTMGKLATACGYVPSKTTRYVDALIKKGLVQRSYNENNRRIVLVSATEKGAALVELSNKLIFEHYDNLIKDIPDEDRAILADSYIKMIEIYKKYCNLPVIPEEL